MEYTFQFQVWAGLLRFINVGGGQFDKGQQHYLLLGHKGQQHLLLIKAGGRLTQPKAGLGSGTFMGQAGFH